MSDNYICPHCVPLVTARAKKANAHCPHCEDRLLRTCPACTCPMCSDEETRNVMEAFADDHPEMDQAAQESVAGEDIGLPEQYFFIPRRRLLTLVCSILLTLSRARKEFHT